MPITKTTLGSETAAVLMRAMVTLNHQMSPTQHALLCANERWSALHQLTVTVETAAKLAEVALAEALAVQRSLVGASARGAGETATEKIAAERPGNNIVESMMQEMADLRVKVEGLTSVALEREPAKMAQEMKGLRVELQEARCGRMRAEAEAGRLKVEAEKEATRTAQEMAEAEAETARLKAEAEKERSKMAQEIVWLKVLVEQTRGGRREARGGTPLAAEDTERLIEDVQRAEWELGRSVTEKERVDAEEESVGRDFRRAAQKTETLKMAMSQVRHGAMSEQDIELLRVKLEQARIAELEAKTNGTISRRRRLILSRGVRRLEIEIESSMASNREVERVAGDFRRANEEMERLSVQTQRVRSEKTKAEAETKRLTMELDRLKGRTAFKRVFPLGGEL